MQRLIVSLAASACLVALLGGAEPASAAFTTFASGNGNDSADCQTPATACRQITAAITKTDLGGTVAVLPGDYAPFVVGEAGKQVDIIGQDGVATITGSALDVPGGGTAAIIVNVNAAGVMPIRIHGLTINAGAGGIAILGNSPEVEIQNCSFAGLGPNYAVDFKPSATGELYITNTTISRSVGSGTGGGVRIAPTGGAGSNVVFDNALVENSVSGVNIDGRNTTGTNTVVIRNSVVSGADAGFGIFAADGGGGATNVTVEGSTISGSGQFGIGASGANATVRVKNSTVTGNANGLVAAAGSKVISQGGNTVAGNTTNGAFTQTLPLQ